MYRRLFIAEKPSLAQAIAACLPGRPVRRDGFIEIGSDAVSHCFGHMLEQAPPEAYDESFKRWSLEQLPIVPARWKLLPKEDARKQLKVLGALLASAELVVNAGDPDREGELLVREVLEHFGYRKPTQRIWLASLDEASVRHALATLTPGSRYDGMYEAALARSRADWLVGMSCTRALTVRNQLQGGAGVLSVGRVQTPTLALVVARDLEIEAFKPRDYFELFAMLEHEKGSFRAKWRPTESVPTDPEGRVLDRALVQAVRDKVAHAPGRVLDYTTQAKKEAAPLPFSLSALQALCSARFGLGAQKVLDIAQALYEKHKLTSYPRSDSRHLPVSQHAEAPDVLRALQATNPGLATAVAGANPALKSAAWDDKKVSAHHAIIPTRHTGSVTALSPDERRVYELICLHYLAQFYPEHTYTAVSVRAQVADELFAASGKVPRNAGWRALFARPAREADEDAETEPEQTLPVMAAGDALRATDAQLKACQTKPAARFTEGTLITAMSQAHLFVQDPEIRKVLKENSGIGTQATRAGILETLKRREFLETRGKQILSTSKGRGLIAAVSALAPQLASPELTALFEQKLSAIEERENTVDAFLAEQVAYVTDVVERTRRGSAGPALGSASPAAGGLACPACEREGMFRRIKGPRGFFWGCAGYRDKSCSFTAPDKRGKPDLGLPAGAAKGAKGKAAEGASLAALPRCPACAKGVLRRTARRDGTGHFWGCSQWREGCKYIASDDKGKPAAPRAAAR